MTSCADEPLTLLRAWGNSAAALAPAALAPAWASLVSLFFWACASQSRLAAEVPPSSDPSPTDVVSAMVVPYPPPPAPVETMPPPPPNPFCVYLDGYWSFGAKDWQWVPGSWVIARQDCAFARGRLFWQTVGSDRSELRFRPSRWVNAKNVTLDCPVASLCPGTSAP